MGASRSRLSSATISEVQQDFTTPCKDFTEVPRLEIPDEALESGDFCSMDNTPNAAAIEPGEIALVVAEDNSEQELVRLREARNAIQQKTLQVYKDTETAAEDCRALQRRLVDLSESQRQRELQVEREWRDLRTSADAAEECQRLL